ncbi:MAG TPA: ATP-binding protein [Phycisphaerae bacterium]|nr:ATP-binding protein [Phycisphaerae bacterium]HRY66448.1 ATP-binding protein [Phycisphaerae bacterium]HSA25844.1 ATP-binding protein [Phycisphaerae bacterium]
MNGQPIRILYIEDDLVDRMALERFVRSRSLPYECTIAESAHDARAHLASKHFDLVISDYALGDGTCLELLPSCRGVPFIVITGTGSEETAVEAMKLGAADYLIKDPDGYYLKVLPATVQNVLQRHKAETELELYRAGLEDLVRKRTAELEAEIQERRRAQEALQASEERLRAALSAANMGTWRWDVLKDQETRDAGLNRILGLDPVESVRNVRDFFDRVHDEDRQEVKEAFLAACRNRGPYLAEFRIVRPDGTIRWLRDQGRPFFEESGTLRYVTGATVDITERKEAEAERARLERRIRQIDKLNALGELALGAAHEFGNCLTVVRSAMELLQDRRTDPESGSHPIQIISQAVAQGATVARSLQTFGRDLPTEKTALDLREVLKETQLLLEHTLPRVITLEVTCASDDPIRLHADRAQLQQVLLNLALNARDAMPEGGRLRICARLKAASGVGDGPERTSSGMPYAELSVTDTGAGISQDILPHIFDPFFSTKPRGKGTGLGLSIVHGIVHDHGGRIDVHSTVGTGTTFTILLPCQEAGVDDEAEGPGREVPRGHGESVLVAVRDPLLRGLAATYLESAGYRTRQAENMAAVEERLGAASGGVQLVILDASLAGEGGFGCLAGVRKMSPSLPIVLLAETTGLPSGRLDAHTLAISGPYDMPQLAELVHQSLAFAKSGQAVS